MISAPSIVELLSPPPIDPWEQGNSMKMLQDLELIMASQLAREGHVSRITLPQDRFNQATNTKLEDGRSVLEAFEAHYPLVKVSLQKNLNAGEDLYLIPFAKNKETP